MQLLACVECGEKRIPLPAGASAATKFSCRDCARRISGISQVANIETAMRRRRQVTFSIGKQLCLPTTPFARFFDRRSSR
jgi:hypothetical protein